MLASHKGFWERSCCRRVGLTLALNFWVILGVSSYLDYRQEKITLVNTMADQAVIQIELSLPLFVEKVSYEDYFELSKEIRRLIAIRRQHNSRGASLEIQEMAVLDNEGRVLGRDAPDRNPLLKAYAGNISGSDTLTDGLTTHWNADKSRFAVTADLRWANQSIGLLYVDYATTNLQTSLEALWNWHLLFMGLAGLLAFVLSIVFSRWVTGPLNSIIGLAISWRLMETMGGTLSAQSVYGEGSTFSVELPLYEKFRSEEPGK